MKSSNKRSETGRERETSALILKIKPKQTNQQNQNHNWNNYNNPLEGILGFIYSHASSGEKEYAQQQFRSRTGIALLSNMQHPFRWPLTRYLQTQFTTLGELSPHWVVNVRVTVAELHLRPTPAWPPWQRRRSPLENILLKCSSP